MNKNFTKPMYGSMQGEESCAREALPREFQGKKSVSMCLSSNTLSTEASGDLSVDYCYKQQQHTHKSDSSTQSSTRGEGDEELDEDPSAGPCSDWVFTTLLGFERNPLAVAVSATGVRNDAAADLRLSMLSNFSTAYNVVSISLALHILENLYESKAQDSSLCSSALVAGMIAGQLIGGTLGDVVGRHCAMALVMFLQVSAALASACSVSLHLSSKSMDFDISIYQMLAFWRFVLGLGCGGVYPLAATLTAESSHSGQDQAKAVALTFSFQGVGYLVVPAFTWLVVSLLGDQSDLAWRIVLGAGAIPGIVLTVSRLRNAVSHKQQLASMSEHVRRKSCDLERQAAMRSVPVSVMDAIRLEKGLIRKILGTGGCWFLFDILFYGNTLFQPVVLQAAFGSAETVAKAARDTLIIAVMALPGYLLSVATVGRLSPRYIQIQGFLVMGLLYLVIGLDFVGLSRNRNLLLLIYGSTFFFSNFGPNATTFMLPSMTFSRNCRSTLNGFSAACGKAGALIGTLVFVVASDRYGESLVFVACAILALVGYILTVTCVSSAVGQRDNGQDSTTQLQGGEGLQDPETGSKNRAWQPAPVHGEEFTEETGLVPIEDNDRPLSMKVVFSRPSLIDYHLHCERLEHHKRTSV